MWLLLTVKGATLIQSLQTFSSVLRAIDKMTNLFH